MPETSTKGCIGGCNSDRIHVHHARITRRELIAPMINKKVALGAGLVVEGKRWLVEPYEREDCTLPTILSKDHSSIEKSQRFAARYRLGAGRHIKLGIDVADVPFHGCHRYE